MLNRHVAFTAALALTLARGSSHKPDPELAKLMAQAMVKCILAPGNTTDRTEAYRQFRGRNPEVQALLKKPGFPVTN